MCLEGDGQQGMETGRSTLTLCCQPAGISTVQHSWQHLLCSAQDYTQAIPRALVSCLAGLRGTAVPCGLGQIPTMCSEPGHSYPTVTVLSCSLHLQGDELLPRPGPCCDR